MDGEISAVTIVGGGDAGLLSALALRTVNPHLGIRVVDDFRESPIDVGKSTYHAIIPLLHDVLEIDEARFFHEVKPVWKGSVYFRDWCGYDPFHYPFDLRSIKPDVQDPRSGESLYYYYEEAAMSTPAEGIVDAKKTPLTYSARAGGYVAYPNMAYHLSIGRFNEFLRSICEERSIELVDDRIESVAIGPDDETIEQVSSQSAEYEADLYVDATGFGRRLIGELDASYRRFGIPFDTAIHATAEGSLGDIVPATVIDTGDAGWFWQIDTVDSRDLGYVFASDFTSEESARAEFEAHRDEQFLQTEIYRFDSGFFEDAWVGNCLAIGNALGFIEPLQSTALTSHLKTAVRLSRLLAAHDRLNHSGVRHSFNGFVRGLWNSIYDFISVHYRYAAGSNEFWQEMQSIPLSEKVNRYISYYDENGIELHDNELVTDDGTTLDMLTFPTSSLYIIMRHMGATSKFYEECDIEVSEEIVEKWRKRNAFVTALADECLTYEQVYEAGVVEEYTRNESLFAQVVTETSPPRGT